MSEPSEGGRGLRWLTAIAAMIAAVVSISAYLFSTPQDMRNWATSITHGYKVKITSPRPHANVGRLVDIRGQADLDDEWSLVVLIQAPDELKYYFATTGSVSIDGKGQWSLTKLTFGSADPKARVGDINKDYKIYALLVDSEGQQQVQSALSRKAPDNEWMPALPHHAGKDVALVHLTA
ncbi:hypothetical protein [Kribbella kalugense]|uniref:Uncharacterized protein n=1 Tax=Kribbella kalugense TaxID=2512221 RepID=A0A4R7ZR85_9ACTN|nr:hypothetical protein [Kribbella kalugense]TDW19331.1 hypothetical protein EV650_5937 [Kribbella kalugense]